jgi:hypothetical protein
MPESSRSTEQAILNSRTTNWLRQSPDTKARQTVAIVTQHSVQSNNISTPPPSLPPSLPACPGFCHFLFTLPPSSHIIRISLHTNFLNMQRGFRSHVFTEQRTSRLELYLNKECLHLNPKVEYGKTKVTTILPSGQTN